MMSVPPRGRGCVETPKSHYRKLVDGSDPAYKGGLEEFYKSHQRKLVDGSDPAFVHIEGVVKLNTLLNVLSRFVSEAGSEQSTNFRWWDSRRDSKVFTKSR